MQAANASDQFRVGQRFFQRFTLVECVGEGGMGVVWLAQDERLERRVALKFLTEAVRKDPGALSDLKRETRNALRLTHQNIVRVYDFHEDGAIAAIAMEYVDGPSLQARKLMRPGMYFEPADLAGYLRQLCEALDYAHRIAGVVHCDLKPSNLLVSSDGVLKIADFGIAVSLNSATTRVVPANASSGTPPYMSPQRLNGAAATPADDLYSLGASLYDLLSGKPPFCSGDIAFQVRSIPPLPLAARRALLNPPAGALPPTWESTVAALLKKEPSARPASGADVVAQLGLDRPVFTPPPLPRAAAAPAQPPVAERATVLPPEEPSNPLLRWVLVAFALCIALGGLVAPLAYRWRQTHREESAVVRESAKERPVKSTVAPTPPPATQDAADIRAKRELDALFQEVSFLQGTVSRPDGHAAIVAAVQRGAELQLEVRNDGGWSLKRTYTASLEVDPKIGTRRLILTSPAEAAVASGGPLLGRTGAQRIVLALEGKAWVGSIDDRELRLAPCGQNEFSQVKATLIAAEQAMHDYFIGAFVGDVGRNTGMVIEITSADGDGRIHGSLYEAANPAEQRPIGGHLGTHAYAGHGKPLELDLPQVGLVHLTPTETGMAGENVTVRKLTAEEHGKMLNEAKRRLAKRAAYADEQKRLREQQVAAVSPGRVWRGMLKTNAGEKLHYLSFKQGPTDEPIMVLTGGRCSREFLVRFDWSEGKSNHYPVVCSAMTDQNGTIYDDSLLFSLRDPGEIRLRTAKGRLEFTSGKGGEGVFVPVSRGRDEIDRTVTAGETKAGDQAAVTEPESRRRAEQAAAVAPGRRWQGMLSVNGKMKLHFLTFREGPTDEPIMVASDGAHSTREFVVRFDWDESRSEHYPIVCSAMTGRSGSIYTNARLFNLADPGEVRLRYANGRLELKNSADRSVFVPVR